MAYPAGHAANNRFAMRGGILTLTEREKETLRLLIRGHDAKSIARDLGLSVHTINERLRDARRKLGVTNSREAARLLAEAEQGGPESFADNDFGVSESALAVRPSAPASRPQLAGYRFAWFGGGMLIMSLMIAVVALSSAFNGSPTNYAQASAPGASEAKASAPASLDSAREWLALVDRQDWDGSWRTAAALLKAQITASQWASTVQPVRQPLGKVLSRTFVTAAKATSLPGAPAGEYETLQFQTNFAARAGLVETVILSHDPSGWKVAGYFIR